MAQQTPPPPDTCTVLYKILTPSEKANLPESDWKGTELDLKDGFIHLSTSHQISGTLERFFPFIESSENEANGKIIFLLAIMRTNIYDAQNRLKFEPAAGSEFGHIYGAIDPKTYFTEEYKLERDSNGKFEVPELPF